MEEKKFIFKHQETRTNNTSNHPAHISTPTHPTQTFTNWCQKQTCTFVKYPIQMSIIFSILVSVFTHIQFKQGEIVSNGELFRNLLDVGH